MAKKYLEQTSQQVFFLKEDTAAGRPRTIGRVITDTTGASIEKDHRQMWLSWDELEIILKAKPRGAEHG